MNPILEKIKKLLRMKRGGTPDEIATALRLAQELAEKHGIDLDGVNPDDDAQRERPINHVDAIIGARIQWECKYAALVADQFFNVNTFIAVSSFKYCIRFVGTEWDGQIAIYVYYFLVGHFRREWKNRRGRCRNRQAFMFGMYRGICSKLRERQPATIQEPGLVRVDHALQRRNDYIAKHFGELKKESAVPDGDAEAASRAGYIAGRETEIRAGVNAAEQKAALEAGRLQLT